MTTLNNRTFYTNVIRIALPIAVQSLIGSSLSLIDNLMVGHLGEVELAAVGAGVQVYFIHWMFLFGFNSGTATFNAQFWGTRDMENIRKSVGFALKVSIAFGLLFFAGANLFPEQIMRIFSTDSEVISLGAKYIRIGSPCFLFLSITQPFVVALRATQQPKIPLIISALALVTNTVLNYIFIFGKFGIPCLETNGAALATVIARCVEMTLILYMVFGRKNILAGKPSEFLAGDRRLAMAITKKAIPTTCNELMWGLGQSMYMAAIGHISVTAYAAAQASNTIQNIFIMAGFSIGDAALILLGAKLGEDKIEETKADAARYVKLTVAVGITGGILLILSSGFLVGLFDFTPEGKVYASRILIVYGITLFINLYNGMMVSGLLRGGGDTLFAAICEIGTIWCIGVPLAFTGAMALHLPVYTVIILIKIEEVVKCFILTYRFKSGKWARNIVKDIHSVV